MPEAVLHVFGILLSLVVITGVFAVLLKYLPDVELEWRDVLTGALFTSILFTIGNFLIGCIWAKRASVQPMALPVRWLSFWCGSTTRSQIFFFGAEFTQVYSNEHGSRPLLRAQQQQQQQTPVQPHQQPLEVAAPHQADSTALAGVGRCLGERWRWAASCPSFAIAIAKASSCLGRHRQRRCRSSRAAARGPIQSRARIRVVGQRRNLG